MNKSEAPNHNKMNFLEELEEKKHWYVHPFKARLHILRWITIKPERKRDMEIVRKFFLNNFLRRRDYIKRQSLSPDPFIRSVAEAYLDEVNKALKCEPISIDMMNKMIQISQIDYLGKELQFLASCYVIDMCELHFLFDKHL